MIDKSRPDRPGRGTLPDFAPLPRHYNRHDGWTAERQRGFIAALADSGSVKAAAHAVNMTPEGAYQLRRHPQAGEFRRAWEAALKLGVQRLEDVAMERALHGVEVPVYHFGAVVGTRRVYNDRLLMFLLRNRAHKRFAADSRSGADAVARGRLKRMKREWRAEWEAEQAAQSRRESEEVLTWLDTKLETMRERWFANMSPRARQLYDAWQEAMDEEDERPALPDLSGDEEEDEEEDEDEDEDA